MLATSGHIQRIPGQVKLACATLLAAVLSANLSVMPVAGAPADVPLPESMAATGDSITRAFNMDWCCFLRDAPEYSWSTGTNPAVDSQYQRLVRARGSAVRSENYAHTGDKVWHLHDQLLKAAAPFPKVEYVTALIGANDLCTSRVADMTTAAQFRSDIDWALWAFFQQAPNAHLALSSIPDIYQLYLAGKDNPSARSAWSFYRICQSMLSSANSDVERLAVVQREGEDNESLRLACSRYPNNCLWDNYASFDFKFPGTDLSPVDYFHPNLRGQNDAARVTWGASFWGSPVVPPPPPPPPPPVCTDEC